MGFVSRVATPTVNGVIERHSGFELLEVIRKHAGEAERRREQPRRFGRQIEARRIRPTNNQGEPS
jgi:hypothetical protein